MHSADLASSEAISVEVAKPVTVAQCHEVIEAQARQIEMLRHCVAQQGEQLASLQERVKLDSHNSSKPSDGERCPYTTELCSEVACTGLQAQVAIANCAQRSKLLIHRVTAGDKGLALARQQVSQRGGHIKGGAQIDLSLQTCLVARVTAQRYDCSQGKQMRSTKAWPS